MNLKHIRTFTAVVECGGVTKAAEHLRITQPALSRQIWSLEGVIGIKLFDTINRRLVLTSNGHEFFRHSRELVAQADAVLARAQSLGKGTSGVLCVGAAPQTISRFFPSFLSKYEHKYPNIRVNLTEASGARQLELVTSGLLHFAVTVPFGRKQFHGHPLTPVPLLVLAHHRYELGRRSTADLTRLAGLPLLVVGREFAARAVLDAACRLAGITPDIRFEGNTPQTLAALAEAGHGVAVVPGTLAFKSKSLASFRLQFKGKDCRFTVGRILGRATSATQARARLSANVR